MQRGKGASRRNPEVFLRTINLASPGTLYVFFSASGPGHSRGEKADIKLWLNRQPRRFNCLSQVQRSCTLHGDNNLRIILNISEQATNDSNAWSSNFFCHLFLSVVVPSSGIIIKCHIRNKHFDKFSKWHCTIRERVGGSSAEES